ncbi:restriction endonuclease subunit S [Streptococcus pseudopneumoniae]|uniref:restriction endonuclease subunit S n=1 Tax=Streptococcus pseudopneumoniae TaxID=257758 RepID=UPI00025AB31F|nr:restriction endonuclease subunit S [Streptococcus pseudopneumoniae]EID25243.1 type I restriction modification DNA specificity domain protein [Streptococcus pseudopneumoniae ATCC BAA-960 = CCUG 49455]MBF9653987.1 restriction endonuclease subunit S [Streptococcus pseudopneumoniae]MBF9670716.1 restriction endonuclease subunit S [Streptococcus pseudopneumoniae]NIB92161.1 restriction endonuclease subunit S [Streptococcus pseudopneumoniae]
MKKVKLGEVATFINGYAFKPQDWSSEGKEIIRIQNLTKTSTEINYYSGTIDQKYIVEAGDILISWSGTLGVFQWCGKSAVLNQHIFKVVFDKIEIDKSYFKYVVEKGLQDAVKHTHGSTMKHLTKKYFDNIMVPYTNLGEQQRIASELDLLSKLILRRQEQLEELNLLVKSRFNEMFGDFYTTLFPKYKIGEKFEVSSGSTPSRDNKLYWDSGTINWVKTTEVINREITETEEKITKFALENTSLKLFPVDTILIAMYGQGQTRGRSAILKVESTSNQACGAIFPNKIDNPVFIWHQLMLRYSELRELGRGGNQPNLNGQLIKNFELIFPPLALQNEFADFVAQVDKSQFACEIAIKVWRNSLKFSII